jgi:hypothetical protein
VPSLLDARVTAVRVYSRPSADYPAQPERRYATRFLVSEVQFLTTEIWFERVVRGVAYEPTEVSCEYLAADGRRVGQDRVMVHVPAEWQTLSSSTAGWGSAAPGSWQPGAYQVRCAAYGRTMAEATFEVVGAATSGRSTPE